MAINPPPQAIIDRLHPELSEFLSQLADGVRVFWSGGGGRIHPTSWWRSVGVNAHVGGHPESQHLLGLAADLAVEPEELEQLAQALRRFGLVAVVFERHVHVQYHPAGFLRAIGWQVTDSGELLDQFGGSV